MVIIEILISIKDFVYNHIWNNDPILTFILFVNILIMFRYNNDVSPARLTPAIAATALARTIAGYITPGTLDMLRVLTGVLLCINFAFRIVLALAYTVNFLQHITSHYKNSAFTILCVILLLILLEIIKHIRHVHPLAGYTQGG